MNCCPLLPPRVNSPCHCSCHSSRRAVADDRWMFAVSDRQTCFETIMVYLPLPREEGTVVSQGCWFFMPERGRTDGCCGLLMVRAALCPGREPRAARWHRGRAVGSDCCGSRWGGRRTVPVCGQLPLSRSGAALRAPLPGRAGPGGPRPPAGAAASAPAGGPSPGPARPAPASRAGSGAGARAAGPAGLGGPGPCAGRLPAGPGRGSSR